MACWSSTSARRTIRDSTVSMIATGCSSESSRTSRAPGADTTSPSTSYSANSPAVVVLAPSNASAVSSSRRGPGNANPHASSSGSADRSDMSWSARRRGPGLVLRAVSAGLVVFAHPLGRAEVAYFDERRPSVALLPARLERHLVGLAHEAEHDGESRAAAL